jgi:two-component system phosphate regulon sensor histidine kinase PhoR
MNKKAIWGIIGLMTAALIGLVLLQVHWISWSIQLNEAQFDTNVQTALGRVSIRLEESEKKIAPPINLDAEAQQNDPLLDEVERLANKSAGMTYRQIKEYLDRKGITESYNLLPLAERIRLDYLDNYLHQELKKQGIEINVNYGVFSFQLNTFVIKDKHYVVDINPITVNVAKAANRDPLVTTKYKVDLFNNENGSPGLLLVNFPEKSSYVWSTVWMTVAASILFTGIILFCFAYTINVIFEQKKLSEIKNDFINNMTHEFKTPIATISLASDSIENPIVINNTEKIKRFVNIIRQENKRMNAQVEKVLQMAVIDRNDQKLMMSELDLHSVITQAVANFSLVVENREGHLTTDLQANQQQVEGDLTHVTNIIHNLMDNANKYSPEKPEILVATHNVKNGIEVIVSDKGVGLSAASKKLIFDKFYRVHTGNLHDVKGFGLGLSYVKAMMDAHNGSITVKSELNQGSSFILFFPFKQA